MTFRETACLPTRIIVSGMILVALAGCSRKSGEAVVLEKEHIAAAEIRETPSAAPINPITSPTLVPGSAANDEAETARELKPSEWICDGERRSRHGQGSARAD
jgi:hypothetical protein